MNKTLLMTMLTMAVSAQDEDVNPILPIVDAAEGEDVGEPEVVD